MKFLVWKCDWFDDTNQVDNWVVVGSSFTTLEDARQFVTQNVGDGLGGKWQNAVTFTCFCKDADNMGTWAIEPTSVPTRDVDATLWGF